MPIYNNVDLSKIFTREAIAQSLGRMAKLPSPLYDVVFSSQLTYPRSAIPVSDIVHVIKNMPVVRRGTQSLSVEGNSAKISIISPDPIVVSTMLDAKDINDFQYIAGTAEGIQSFIDNIIDKLRRIIAKTTRALAYSALTGTIRYHASAGLGELAEYEVEYGTIKTHLVQAAKRWAAGAGTIADIIADLIAMSTLVKESGYGSEIKYFVGAEVFKELAKQVTNLKDSSSSAARINANAINIAGFDLLYTGEGYTNVSTDAIVPAVADKDVLAIATDAPHRVSYLAIDDVDAKLQATPLFVKTKKMDDPSGYKIIAQSKPLPIAVPSAICKATVLA